MYAYRRFYHKLFKISTIHIYIMWTLYFPLYSSSIFFIELMNIISLKWCPLSNTDSDCYKVMIFFLMAVDEERDAWPSNEQNAPSLTDRFSQLQVHVTRCPCSRKVSVIDVKKTHPNTTCLSQRTVIIFTK